ncbi:hypothetical protein PYW07_013715 [Mythimna separata]|uniref:Uncharacterized protein n=1 Tax=Mythimna separata TaxID=271217 RepID=A0AAD8DPN6_MYTSE|nr:hypothetical protein PYW07_013715 [Mythimna separata]
MPVKYFLLITLVLTLSEHMASCHILTSTNSDVSMLTCMKMLTYAVADVLCPRYGDYSSEEVFVPSVPREMMAEKWAQRESLLKRCCMKPCSYTELMQMC